MRTFVLLNFLILLQTPVYGKESFSTQVTSDLTISGMRCEGGELSERSERVCQRGQWLIAFNDRPAFLAKLRNEGGGEESPFSFYEIVPKDRMVHQERKQVGRYWVKVGVDQTLEFAPRGLVFYPEL